MSDKKKSTRREVLMGAVGAAAAGAGGYALYKAATHQPTVNPGALDLDPYKKIDPALLAYTEAPDRRIALKMSEPRGLAVDSAGQLSVTGDNRIAFYRPDGTIRSETLLGGEARCVACAPDGRTYVGLRDRLVVIVDGRPTQSAPLGGRAVLTSIAPAGGLLFAADAGQRSVHRFAPDATHLGTFGRDFVIPSPYFPIAAMPDGTLRIGNTGRHRIETWSVEGEYSGAWGRHGTDIDRFCGCCNPIGLAALPDGSLVAAEKGLTRIKICSRRAVSAVVAGPEQFQRHDTICARRNTGCKAGGLIVATGPDAAVYVLDPWTAEVRVFVRKEATDHA